MLHPTNRPNPGFTCALPINTGPQTFVLRSAIAHLDRWTPAARHRRRACWETTSISPAQYVLDANGVRGGIRTPAVDAPVAALSGLGQSGTTFCFLFGTTTPSRPTSSTRSTATTAGSSEPGRRRPWMPRGRLPPAGGRLNILVVGAQADIP